MLSKSADSLPRNVIRYSPFVDAAAETLAAARPKIVADRFSPGRLVRIRRGAFAGIEGAVLRERDNRRLIIALAVSQSGVPLEIDAEMLEPID